MEKSDYCRIVPMTYEEKVKMYMKCSKIELAKMLAAKGDIDQKVINVQTTNSPFTQCTSWSDCTNPHRDCFNCPLRYITVTYTANTVGGGDNTTCSTET